MPASSLRAKPGTSSMQAGELALAEHDELHVGLGDDGRVAGRLVEEGELAEGVARAEVGDLAAVAARPGPAVEDHEELVAGLALGDEGLAGRDASRPRPGGRPAASSLREQAEKSGTCGGGR